MAMRSLDVPRLQVLVHYGEDDDGLQLYHRFLLYRITDARWVTITPDFELVVHDLAEIAHQVLDRAVVFPSWADGALYAFDEGALDRNTVKAYLARAKVQAAVLGAGQPEDIGAVGWMVASPGDSHFGRIVPTELVGDRALVKWDDEIRLCMSVLDSEVDAQRERLRDDAADIRVLGDFHDEAGRRTMLFDQAPPLLRE